VHHVIEHSAGGATTLENGALVHKACHPKGEAQTAAFATKFAAAQAARGVRNAEVQELDLSGINL
jgi:hypothetical protein